MKLTILGSGTSVPHPHRATPSHWLETSKGTVLLDAGPDAPHRMAEEQLDWPNLDAIWISHFHLDHLGGLTPFLFGIKWAPQTQTRTKPLRICGPTGLRAIIDAVNDSNNYRLFEQRFRIEIVEVSPNEDFEIMPGISATTLSTPHTNESLALRLKDEDSKLFVYTSDTGFSEDLIPFAKDADLLLMECSYRRNKPVKKHLELVEAMNLARACAPKRVVLTHLYPEWDDVDLVAEARRLWSGETIEAKDGLRLEI
ncbi:MAG TPA: MBL fold metallo-hydrolase [Pyrinomonadaceae bacterium]|nr:MBL fold metallo-hydrolase [Pyrinomonadaceae bacterium]